MSYFPLRNKGFRRDALMSLTRKIQVVLSNLLNTTKGAKSPAHGKNRDRFLGEYRNLYYGKLIIKAQRRYYYDWMAFRMLAADGVHVQFRDSD